MTVFSRQLKMNMTNRNPYRSGACGSIRTSHQEQQNAPDGGNPRNVTTTTDTEFSKSDGIMNTKTNTSLLYKSLAVLALSCALANTALGQVSRIDWGDDNNRLPSITYGTALGNDQFNARALDSQGNAVVGGSFTYYWGASDLPQEQSAEGDDWVANCPEISPSTVAFNGRGFNPARDDRTYSCDHDDNSGTPNKTGTFDWLYLDVGEHTIRATYRIPGSGNRSWNKEVSITVTKAPLTVSPRPVSSRAYGDENFKGFESDLNPTWPSGEKLFIQTTNEPIVADLVIQGGSQFRELAQDNDDNEPINDATGANPIMIPVIPEDDPTHYTRTGVDVQFVGFVRGETYPRLVNNHRSIATTTEINNDPLVPRRFKLRVRTFEDNDPTKNPTNNNLYRSAPVGTRGIIDFEVLPQFKNYDVSVGQTATSATLTVTKAKIEIRAKADYPKRYGNTINPRFASDSDDPVPNSHYTGQRANESRLNPDLIRPVGELSSPFAWGNNFRFGEGFIERIVLADSAGWAADATVGKHGITLIQNHQILGDETAFLNSYDITVANGNVKIGKRRYKLLVEDETQNYGDILPPFPIWVHNPAPHLLVSGANTRTNMVGNDVYYRIADLRTGFWQNRPISSTANPGVRGILDAGSYTIRLTNGSSATHEFDGKTQASLTINRANLILRLGNFNSSLGQPPAAIFVTPVAGHLSQDVDNGRMRAGVLTNDPEFEYSDDDGATYNDLDSAGLQTMVGSVGQHRIRVKNRNDVQSLNYNVDFQYTSGGDPAEDPPVAPSYSIYTVGDRGVDIRWGGPDISPVTYGNLLGNSRLNAQFWNPNTNLPVEDSRNDAGSDNERLMPGVDYEVIYAVEYQNGAQTQVDILRTDGADRGTERYHRLLANKIYRISVEFKPTPAGITKINGFRDDRKFGRAKVYRNLRVNRRTITVKPNDRNIALNESIPTFSAYSLEGLPGGPYLNGIMLLNDAALTGANTERLVKFVSSSAEDGNVSDAFKRLNIIDRNARYTTTAVAGSPKGDYPITASNFHRAGNGNIEIAYKDGKLTIGKARVTLNWSGNIPAITYGTPLSATHLNAQVSPTSVEGSIEYKANGTVVQVGHLLDAGAYTITAKFKSSDDDYADSPERGRSLQVRLKTLNLSVADAEKIYGDANPSFTIEEGTLGANGLLVPPLAATNDTNMFVTFRVDDDPEDSENNPNQRLPVGRHPIVIQFDDPDGRSQNYRYVPENGFLTVRKRAVTITPANRNIDVGHANPNLFLNDLRSPGGGTTPNQRVRFDNLAPHEAIDGGRKFSDGGNGFPRLNTNFPGLRFVTDLPPLTSEFGQTSPIRVANIGATSDIESNYEFTRATGTLTVSKRVPTINWANATIMYGQKIRITGGQKDRSKFNDGARTHDVNIFNASASPGGGTFRYTLDGSSQDFTDDTAPRSVGKVKFRAEYTPKESDQDEYRNQSKVIEVTIVKRPLTVRIKDQPKTYGGVSVNLDVTDSSVVDFGANFQHGRTQNASKQDYNRLVGGETLATLDRQLVLTTNARSDSPVGDYYIAVVQMVQDSNYDIKPVFGSVELRDGITRDPNGRVISNIGANIRGIGERTSLVTGDYGPQFEYRNGAGQTGAVPQPIANAEGPQQFYAGRVRITPANLTIKAMDLVKTQGSPNPAYAAVPGSPDQLKNNDTLTLYSDNNREGLLKTRLVFSSTVEENTDIGRYPIIVTGGSSDNYIITYQNGSFTVLPPITWTPTPLVYGIPLGAAQLNASSEVAGDFEYSASNAEGVILPAGTHTLGATFTPTNPPTGTADFSVESTLQVSRSPLIITAEDVVRQFGETNPVFVVSYLGFVNGEGPDVLGGALVFDEGGGTDDAVAGVYDLTPSGLTSSNYDISFVAGSITVTKAPAEVTLADLVQGHDGLPKMVSVVTVPEGLAVDVTYDGSSEAPIVQGSYAVSAIVNDSRYSGSAEGALRITDSAAVILADLAQVYDGAPRMVSVTTDPAGLEVAVTYDGSAEVPVGAGMYEVRAEIDDPNGVYSGFAEGTLVVAKGSAQISFVPGSLTWPISGIAAAEVVTVPADLNVGITYSGVSALPQVIGGYDVVATIDDVNWVGSVAGIFEIVRAPQQITMQLPARVENPGRELTYVLFAAATSNDPVNLPVEFSIGSGTDASALASVSGNFLTIRGTGNIELVASQAGNDYWASVERTFTIEVTGQPAVRLAEIQISDLEQEYDGNPKSVGVATVPAGLTTVITYDGSLEVPVNAGTYEVRVVVSDEDYEGEATAMLTITPSATKIPVDIEITNLEHKYDGNPKSAMVTMNPAGIAVSITYNGSPEAPVNAGTYEVRVVVTAETHEGFKIDRLVIAPGDAQISFVADSLSQLAGQVSPAEVVTVPVGLVVSILYDGLSDVPDVIGEYAVVATVEDSNWEGRAAGTFTIRLASQEITIGDLRDFSPWPIPMAGMAMIIGPPLPSVEATSGLPVTLEVDESNSTGEATLSASGNRLIVTQPGAIVLIARQAGNDSWAPAEKSFTITVTGRGVPVQAPQVSVRGLRQNGLEIGVTGAPNAIVSIMAADTLPSSGALAKVGEVILDAAGNGVITVPTTGNARYFIAE